MQPETASRTARQMSEVDIAVLPVVGALDQQRTTNGGIIYRRSPRWARPQIVDPAMDFVVQVPAGVRFEFTTSARALELDVMLTTVEMEGLAPPPVRFDLVSAGQLLASVPVVGGTRVRIARDGSLELVQGSPSTVHIPLRGDDRIPLEVWLPHTAAVQILAARTERDRPIRPLERKRRRWVHHGSSISHCLEAPSPTQTWPALAALAADVDLLNLGFAAQCVLDPHVARTIRDVDADVITLKVGINIVAADLMRERVFVPALHGFLDTIRDGHPSTPIIVSTAIYSAPVEDTPGPIQLDPDGRYVALRRSPESAVGALTLRRSRELVAQAVGVRRENGDVNTHLLDGLALFGPADAGDLPDALHPSPAGYRRIAERFHRLILADTSFEPSR